ncbi:MAG: 3-phosphoserine/phosphohydroxythreonine transaminase [Clostridia bacterium]|nr:3-phosphoserine/phosphohydroxythreonine transaminase [Clostridia bacterium]MBQ8743430.1 3-phosphoserine/phosphohydroxythreonine transaminase [Clostridia bacterium]
MNRVYNFSAGPSMLPVPVLERAASEMMCYGDSGMSVMEMSHRSPVYEKIIADAEAKLRELMNIPDNYKVLFLQGGASTQFAAVPLNLIGRTGKADYIVSGQFSGKAYKEAQKMGYDVKCIATSKDTNFDRIPVVTKDMISPDASYVHICFNNTIYGTKYSYIPDTGDVPLVADMSSCIISEPVDVTKFGVIYAGAQKNMAPAGVTLVIVREDLLECGDPKMPSMLDWKLMAENGSMYNTPPCYSIYVAGLVYEWILGLGGLDAMKEKNVKKAALLYDYLDSQDYYIAPVQKDSRSMMNVTFVTGVEEIDKKFPKEAAAAGLVNLKGHRSVGGMRASIYNAMPIEGVEALVEFMKKFAAENPKA